MDQKEKEVKAKLRLDVNRTLLGIIFTIFALIISLNPSLFQSSIWVPLQLTLAIPLLISSIFARSKLAHTNRIKIWENYGCSTFVSAYSFLINILGILISTSIGLNFSLIFIVVNILSALLYSTLEVIENKSKLKSRIKKDLFFIIILILGGILPILGIY